MRPWHALVLFALTSPLPLAAAETADDPLAGTTREPGFVDVYRDLEAGRVLIGVHELDQPMLMITALPGALGSNDVGLDRGQTGTQQLVRFRRVGERLLMIADNTRFVADSSDPAERVAATDAFAPAVLWAGKILKKPGVAASRTSRRRGGDERDDTEGGYVVDFASFLAADRHGIRARLKATQQGDYAVDAERSAVLAESARSFPDNAEFDALLTFRGPGEAEYVRQVAADPEALTLRQHVSLVRLPPPGFVPRSFHTGSGAWSVGSFDFAQPLTRNLDVRWQPRFRLEKTDPAAAVSTVRKPIVFHLDPGTPEPIRSALLDGARWWAAAFEAAGYRDAYRVEMLPPDADPMDVRYSIITWAHRATRGWSYGGAIVDPRTGEIIKGSVTLGSQRVRQDILIAETLLAPYDKPAAQRDALGSEAREMALARLRQLAAHEVGHSLGFAHNFAASRNGNGSVMDYPIMYLAANETVGPGTVYGREASRSNSLSLRNAYGVGTGPWDHFLVKHGYAQFPSADEANELAKLRTQIAAAGYAYVSDPDARAPGDAQADGLLWDFGPDTLTTFEQILRVRQQALARFSTGVLPPERQAGEFEARLVPLYLLHRYQTEAVARLLGGVSYRYGLAGEGAAGTQPVPAARQLAARAALLRNLSVETLALPANVLDLLSPQSNEYNRTREYFTARTGPVPDALAPVEAATAQTLQFLLDPSRLNRLAWQHARDPQQPGVRDTIDALLAASWRATPDAASAPGAVLVRTTADWVVLDALLTALDAGQLRPSVDAELRAALVSLQTWLVANPAGSADRRAAAQRIASYLADPRSVMLRPLPVVPPGAPI